MLCMQEIFIFSMYLHAESGFSSYLNFSLEPGCGQRISFATFAYLIPLSSAEGEILDSSI